MNENTIILAEFHDCIIGISSKNILVYDQDEIIEKLSKDMTFEEAVEYFYYNIEGAYMGKYTPIYVTMGSLKDIQNV